jgi:hypothetical protein
MRKRRGIEMTKKHFKLLADVVLDLRYHGYVKAAEHLERTLQRKLKELNPSFSDNAWMHACGHPFCPNCGQWEYAGNCLNDCRDKGFVS